MNLLEEIKNGESKTLELKERLPKNIAIAKTVIAFANASGGKLIIGVNDQREVVGIDDENIFDIQDKIASIIYDVCYPNIIPEIYTANFDGSLVLVVEVFPGNLKPYYIKHEGKNEGTCIRIGATNRKAGYEHILELERQRRNLCFDEDIHYDYDINSLDLSSLEKEFNTIHKTLNIEKIQNLKLLKNDQGKQYPSNGLLILLGIFEHVRIKCSRFKGKNMDIFNRIRYF
ncbi:transcriptional regulator [Candidatus Magnetomorum sp. HK-1]|nr:transcriptional regulator [Candidatus Magnetomorum sp. HK-1]